jgi:hypothetical protein
VTGRIVYILGRILPNCLLFVSAKKNTYCIIAKNVFYLCYTLDFFRANSNLTTWLRWSFLSKSVEIFLNWYHFFSRYLYQLGSENWIYKPIYYLSYKYSSSKNILHHFKSSARWRAASFASYQSRLISTTSLKVMKLKILNPEIIWDKY